MIGRPEPLKHGFYGYRSRRSTDERRLVCGKLNLSQGNGLSHCLVQLQHVRPAGTFAISL
nr:type II toxin-antitoxin system YoeB family toxin [Arthrobacter sp. H-02-3]